MIDGKQTLASADPAAPQQAAAEQESASQADRIAALELQLAESSEVLATTLREAAGLQAQVDDLTAANDKSIELIDTLNEDKSELLLQVSELKAAAAAGAQRGSGTADRSEDELHNLWCAAGGQLGQFEAVKRFVASL